MDDRPPSGPSHLDRFEVLAEAVTEGILTAGADGGVTYANPAARELFWRTGHELLGDGWLDAVEPADRPLAELAAERVRLGGATEVLELQLRVLGARRLVRARLDVVRDTQGAPVGWIALFGDITADRADADELTRRATHDPLTGLPNRALLEDRIIQSLARCQRNGAAIAVFFIDVDRFKEVNDHHGHRTGDQVLAEVAGRLATSVRAEDTAARLGGDEFVVVAEGMTTDVARKVADRMARAVERPVQVGDTALELRVSIGVVWTERTDRSPAELVEAADAAMYEAKRAGSRIAFAPGP